MIHLNGKPGPWKEGMTVSDLLETVESGRSYAVVRVNETTVTRPHFTETRIPDNAEVFLIPMIAGG